MANTISIQVDDLTLVLTTYNQIKVYRADTSDGVYVEITTAPTRITINTQDTLYKYTDTSGLSTHYYKTAYFNSSNSAESQLSAAVAAVTITDQLLANMQVVFTLSKDIKNTSGVSLGTDYTFYFTTVYTPMYSSIRKLRLEIGSFIRDLPDDSLNFALFEASLMADSISWVANPDNDFFKFARREWTTCKAAQILLHNVLGIGGLKSKRLDNLEVEYDSKTGQKLLDKIEACLARWEIQVVSGGNSLQKPSMVVKGECDPDAPNVGRMWESGLGVSQAPGANFRYRIGGSRRYISMWKKSF